MPHERLASLRERLRERRERRTSERKARERNRARKARKKKQRLEENNPDGLTEKAQATAQRASEVAGEAAGVVTAEQQLVAAELGVSTSRAKQIMEQGSQVLDRAAEAGSLDQLDVDNDGDTDILTTFESQLDEARDEPEGVELGGIDPTEPVIDFQGEQTEPAFKEVDVGLDAEDDVLR